MTKHLALRFCLGFIILTAYRLTLQTAFLLIAETNSIWGEANGRFFGPVCLAVAIVVFGFVVEWIVLRASRVRG